MRTGHKIIIGDSRYMPEVLDESVHLIITSPPYWQLKDYEVENQIGFNDSYEEYINNLNLVWNECYRTLHKGCRLCINIGDQFARSVYYGRYKVIPIRTEIVKFCESIGFDYMGAIIWQKKTTMNTTGGATVMGSFPYPRNGIIEIDYEFILIFKKPGITSPPSRDSKTLSKLTKEEWKEYFIGHWYFGGARQDKHLAVFPEELPRRLIKMFTYTGETVMDPFLGSGTTSKAAKNLIRNSIGYEINEEYLPIIEAKMGNSDLMNESHMEVLKQKKLDIDFKEKIKELSYIFKDEVKFDKKIDPKSLNFGSRISKNGSSNVKYLHVVDTISPNLLKMDNGLIVKLIGIVPKKERFEEAVKFLKDKTKRQLVFFKFDETKYDNNNNLLAYVYLKNKTFLNAHLIKNGLADVDLSFYYRLRTKFSALSERNHI